MRRSCRPRAPRPRRLRFNRAVSHDKYLRDYRNALRARELAELDWFLYRVNCNPFRKKSPARGAYDRAFLRARLADPRPPIDKLPSIPAARRTEQPPRRDEV